MLYADQTFLVLGLGESGIAMARWLTRQGARVRVADTRATPPGLAQLRQECPQVEAVCGPFGEHLLAGIQVLALSPGVSVNEAVVALARARQIRVTGEIDLFVEALNALDLRKRCKLIAITGTNGKTTTTTLAGELVRGAGLDAAVAGNISPAALQELMARLDCGRLPNVWVLELSSFQLETTASLRADAALVLNLTDDHLDRHGDMAAYGKAKEAIFNGSPVRILNRDDAGVMAMAESAKSGVQVLSFGLNLPEAGHYGVRNIAGETWLVCGNKSLLARKALPLAGDHNVTNALAALALCAAIGIPMAPMLETLKHFKGLSHRVEWVGAKEEGIDYYDDSKGTNVGATLAALQGLGRPVVLIAGGDGKGQDFSPLRPAFAKHARAVVLIGRDAQLIEAQTRNGSTRFVHAQDMDEAVARADELAQAGDAVLLSPACASWDMFRNYAHRAEVFVAAVRRIPGVRS